MKATRLSGIIYALLAAIFNGTVGVFSVKLFQSGLSPNQVAFYKCSLGLIIISLIVFSFRKGKALVTFFQSKWIVVAVCAFFGFFVLYHFETNAYVTTNVSTVVFILFGSATVFSFLLSAISERRFFNVKEMQAIVLSIVGLYLIFSNDGGINLSLDKGLINAALAGLGYGLFLFLSKKLKLGSGIPQMCILLLFGSIYLYIPVHQELKISDISPQVTLILILLAILPTIGGFWCTTKALTLTSSQSVQLIELSEPIFAIIFSMVFLGQVSTISQYIGGGLVFFAIFLHEFNILPRRLKTA
ncbi:DMT family transporter [Pectobacteriaceae bacterium CE70]|nr:DMT family transporter [Pectobacteriaceae bacterium C52]WJV65254.1 DMT family transporter [Pectobacteriaceae bacterium CE70]WJY09269.1 DMT family transporter [Pectobacteriaceae bacterium C80]